MLLLGAKLAAIAEAEGVIEATQAIQGAAVLDAIAFVKSAEEAAARVVSNANYSFPSGLLMVVGQANIAALKDPICGNRNRIQSIKD